MKHEIILDLEFKHSNNNRWVVSVQTEKWADLVSLVFFFRSPECNQSRKITKKKKKEKKFKKI